MAEESLHEGANHSALLQQGRLDSELAHPLHPPLLAWGAWELIGITPELLQEKNSGQVVANVNSVSAPLSPHPFFGQKH